jgi:uncharacterized protein with GYD domain
LSASSRSSRGRGCAPARPETAGCRRAGGKLHGYWYAFGDADGYVPGELPDDVAAASTLTKVAASGVFASVSTTKLLTVEEMLAALRGARDVEYRAPGAAS